MAEQKHTKEAVGVRTASRHVWADAQTGDTFATLPLNDYRTITDLAVQVRLAGGGALGTEALQWEGSNDEGANWSPLFNILGTEISLAAVGVDHARDRYLLIRPKLSGGSGGSGIIAACTIFYFEA